MKKWLPFIIAAGLIATVGFGGSIKNWAVGDIITAGDLNANFNHIHNTMVGGHGARLVNADVNPSANIASSKLAAGANIPVAWAHVTSCLGGTCTVASGSGISSAVYDAGAGGYVAVLNGNLCSGAECAVVFTPAGGGRACWGSADGVNANVVLFGCGDYYLAFDGGTHQDVFPSGNIAIFDN